ncbi:hypothetical protein [Rhizobacter sp. SG703]|uniref:hypothetical protein n=1 Tax=Rhizobacter sp. SG703 TaxID=2587140 RepID=UPI0014450581|nr:hypothetical protein [Rhizobacter sp. SG703]NKI94345.1 hypothetical protein [Rhizobacter sp. SG703]
MQQAISVIPMADSKNEVLFEMEPAAVRNEPVVLDAQLLRLISGGTDLPNKGW